MDSWTKSSVRARAGRIIGRDHMGRQTNCQDSYALIEQEGFTVGILCDGCGTGHSSEVGAALAARYLADRAAALLGEGCPLQALSDRLHRDTLAFLEGLLALVQPADPVLFIRDTLLFTILGVLTAGREALIFAAGDGLIAIDDRIELRDQQNQPAYIAYRLLEGSSAPDGFDVIVPPSGWRRLAIASDGMEPALLTECRELAHPRSLQRRLNAWSNNDLHFRDDATTIVLERIE